MKALRSFFTENVREKIIALLLTVAVWVGVVASREEAISFPVKVRFEAGPDHIVTTPRPVEEIYVQAKGSVFAAAQARSEEQEMVVDVRHRDPGRSVYFVDERDIPLARHLKIEQVVPREIAFTISRKASKTTRLDPIINGQPKKGYRMSRVTVDPATVSVVGPEEVIASLETIATDPVDVSGATAEVSRSVRPVTGHSQVRVVPENTTVKVTVSVVRDIRELYLAKVPLLVDGGVATEITPPTVAVRVRGPIEAIERITESGLSAFVENLPARLYVVPRYYFKDLPTEVEIIEMETPKQITIRKKNP